VSVLSLNFDSVALVLHIASVTIAFGAMFAYPFFAGLDKSIIDPEGVPFFHRGQVQVIHRLVNPGVVVAVASGLALAADTGTVTRFYSEWGLVVAIVLGIIAGKYLAPREARLASIAASDLESTDGLLSSEYHALRRRVAGVGCLVSAIVFATIVVMVAHR